MKRWLPAALAVLTLAVAGAGYCWQQYHGFLQTPLRVGQNGLTFNVQAGSSLRTVLTELETQAVTRVDWRWRLLGRLHCKTIKTGEYLLPEGILPEQLLDLLASGKVITYRFTIVEGWTVRQLLAALGDDPVLQHTLASAAGLTGIPGLPEGNPEGWFLPETYVFVRGDSDRHILARAYADMQKALSDAWHGRDQGLPYETPEELLIMASIIEKETSIASERADIAGVFVRRLQKRWRLETDPTVIYGLGQSFDGDIRSSDLKTDNPYNTYTRHGLPPTPIALPGKAALQAAAHPAAGEAMFFVANGQGGHTFSVTLEEHNRAVQALIRRERNPSAKSGDGT
jgi:UPF0755 protein